MDKTSKIYYTVDFGEKIELVGILPYKDSFVALHNYKFSTFHLVLNTTPIHHRQSLTPSSELWIVENSNDLYGEYVCSKRRVLNNLYAGFCLQASWKSLGMI